MTLLHHLPLTFAIIRNNNESRPIEKKVSASTRDLRLGLTMTPTAVVTPTTRPATRSQAQNISPEHEPWHHRDFFTASRRCSRCREVIKSPRSLVCSFFRSSLHADLTIHTQPTESFSPAPLPPSCILQHKPLGDASNPPSVHPTAPAAHHGQYGPAALPSAPLPYSKCCAVSIRDTRGSLHKNPRGSL